MLKILQFITHIVYKPSIYGSNILEKVLFFQCVIKESFCYETID